MQNLNLHGQAMQVVVEKYLERRGGEDINFIKQHLGTSQNIIQGLNSHAQTGLNYQQQLKKQSIECERKEYTIDKIKLIKQKIWEEISSLKNVLILLMLLIESAVGNFYEQQQMINSFKVCFTIYVLTSILQITASCKSSISIFDKNKGKQKQNGYFQVIRSSRVVHIVADEILAGDILLLQDRQISPVSALLLSVNTFRFDQQLYGNGCQNKMTLENCLEYIENKTEIQLKMEVDKHTLPSPVIVKGSRLVQGGTAKLLVLTLQGKILQGNGDQDQNQWLKKWKKQKGWLVGRKDLCLLTIAGLNLLGLIVKIRSLGDGKEAEVWRALVTCLQSICIIGLLSDEKILLEWLKGQYANVMKIVERNDQLARLLSIKQILITEDNIYKYDKVNIKKFVLFDNFEPIDYNLLPALHNHPNANILTHLLQSLAINAPPSPHLIVHINNADQKVFSVLHHDHFSHDQPSSIAELIKSQVRQMENVSLRGIDKNIQNQRQNFELEEYLSKKCNFTINNIVDNITRLAQSPSKTYYYLKCSLARLNKVEFILRGGQLQKATVQQKQKIMLLAKHLQSEGNSCFLMGFDEGAFNKHNIRFLVALVSVEITCDNQISRRIQDLQRFGINSVIVIMRKQQTQEFLEQQLHQINNDFLKRKWITPKQYFCKIDDIYKAGGKLLCQQCSLYTCSCSSLKNSTKKLSNLQGFLDIIEDVKCVYGLKQEGLNYLEQGFEELGIPTLRIANQEAKTPEIINKIIASRHLFLQIKRIESYWLTLLFTLFICLFPFNLVTFNSIFTYQQLYALLFLVRLQMTDYLFKTSQDHYKLIKQNIIEQDREGNISISSITYITCFVSIFTITSIAIFFSNPFISTNFNNCKLIPRFYHNINVISYICNGQIIYSQTSTFFFVFIWMTFWFNTFFKNVQPLKIKVFIINLIYLAIFIGIFYKNSLIFQASSDFQIQYLAFAIGLSFIVNLFAHWGTKIITNLFQNQPQQKVKQKYASLLCQYKNGNTLAYALQD